MSIVYRIARTSDHSELAKLYGQFVNQPERYLGLDNDSFQQVLASQDTQIFVAQADNSLIGFVCFSTRSVFRYPRPIVEVEELYVSEDHRRQGIAKGLMAIVDEFAQNIEADYVFLASDSTRKEAHQFYIAIGYDQYAHHFRKKC